MSVQQFLEKRSNRLALAFILIGGMVYFWSKYSQGYESSEKNTVPPATN